MFSFLRSKNHPFAVEAFFERSLVLTFAAAKEELQPLIPECLALDTFNDQWAFVAVAMVQATGLRPKGFPRLFGNDFFLIGYRVFVRYTNPAGRRLRGLYILKSETDNRKMEFFGNIFTHYNYTTTDIRQTQHDHEIGGAVKAFGFSHRGQDRRAKTFHFPSIRLSPIGKKPGDSPGRCPLPLRTTRKQKRF